MFIVPVGFVSQKLVFGRETIEERKAREKQEKLEERRLPKSSGWGDPPQDLSETGNDF